ncbi:Invertase [Mycoblastus sanguinarius]|nr:Invertase [Mycoblastus sanguinarius]
MRFTHRFLLLALTAPLSVIAQRGGPGGSPGGYTYQGGAYGGPGGRPSTTSTTPVGPEPTSSGSPEPTSPSSPEPTSQNTPPPNPTTPSSPQTSTGGGGGGGSCSGSGMIISWSGEAVSYSWSGGSGTTTGCTNLGTTFEGQVAIGGSGGTIFEGNPSGYFDISYILGYTVPVVCSNSGAYTGCNKDLFSMGSCPGGGGAGSVCKNPTGPGGSHDPGAYANCATCTSWCYACAPPDPFFRPCAGLAYTFPYDDDATVGPAKGAINCCVGTGCAPNPRTSEGGAGHPELTRNPPCGLCANGASSKRGLEGIFEHYKMEARALSPSLLPRRHTRSSHNHAIAHDLAKVLH